MDNYLPVNGMMTCLKKTILKMIENGKFFDSDACEKLNNPKKLNNIHTTHTEKTQEGYYLRNIVQNVRFYRKQLDVLPKHNKNDKLVYEQIQNVVHTFETAKVNIYIFKNVRFINHIFLGKKKLHSIILLLNTYCILCF